MPDQVRFFVPRATADNQEEVYGQLATLAGSRVLDPDKRIYSITFMHDGTQWTATVGETLTGTKTKTSRSKGRLIERSLPQSDAAMVLAVFPGNPYMVVTNARPLGDVVSYWENPFMAGQPSGVRLFDKAEI